VTLTDIEYQKQTQPLDNSDRIEESLNRIPLSAAFALWPNNPGKRLWCATHFNDEDALTPRDARHTNHLRNKKQHAGNCEMQRTKNMYLQNALTSCHPRPSYPKIFYSQRFCPTSIVAWLKNMLASVTKLQLAKNSGTKS
jgi:hypothetical protein